MSERQEPKLCPFFAGPLNVHCGLPLEGKSYKYALCLRDKCAMWRVGDPVWDEVGVNPNGSTLMQARYPLGGCGLAGKP